MGIETYLFTVYTMLIGMFIVFLAMIVFSVIMVVLKAVARGRSSAGPRNAAAKPGTSGATSGQGDGRPLPAWAMVAVAAYLTAEGESREGPSAEAWRPEVNQYDPWLAGGQFSRRRVGV
jgi:hypothetical protein